MGGGAIMQPAEPEYFHRDHFISQMVDDGMDQQDAEDMADSILLAAMQPIQWISA